MQHLKRTYKKTRKLIQHNLHTILAALLLSITLTVIYWRDFEILANEAIHTESSTHIVLIPFFVAYLLYRRKEAVSANLSIQEDQKEQKCINEAIGIAFCLVAFLLYWYGSYTFYPLEYHLLSLPIFIAGATTILFNFKTLQVLLFPILFLLFLIPPPTEIIYTTGGALANFNTQASYTILQTLGLPVTLQTSYGSPTLTLNIPDQPMYFAIDLPCSGIYSLVAFIMFATFLAYIATGSAPKKATLFALGIIVFIAMNILRITTIITIGYHFGEEAAMLIFHNFAGWILIFTGMLLTLLLSEKLLKIQISPPPKTTPTCPTCKNSPKTTSTFCPTCESFTGSFKKPTQKFWAKLILLLLCSYTVTLTLQAPTFAIAQDTLEMSTETGFSNATDVFPQIPDHRLTFLYRDEQYEKIANQDASLLYAYFPDNFSQPTIYLDVNIATTISNLHNWEVCLITWQTAQGNYPLVTVLDQRDIQLLPDTPIVARYLVFEAPSNYTQVTLYWYEKATFHMGLTNVQRYVRISLIILTSNSTNYPTYEETLLQFGETIAAHWEPLKSQSLISLGIPTQQTLLILAIAFITTTKTVEITNQWRKKTNNLKLFNRYASPTEKHLLKTINELNEEGRPATTKTIASAIAKKTKPITNKILKANLAQLEENGLIRKSITEIQGKPILIWKS
jgi:exosortase